ncbi:MAG: hypothetical protein IPH77_06285 [Ignavibacteria bacterium]|nr:hypothetical protein [Ignavibacteria bacterium]
MHLIRCKWYPECGDYSILKQTQTILPDRMNEEDFVFISGNWLFVQIYLLYGYLTERILIHGRANFAIASGLKAPRPEPCVWL